MMIWHVLEKLIVSAHVGLLLEIPWIVLRDGPEAMKDRFAF